MKKFLQLKKAGATAHPDVDTQAGEAWVRLSVQLQKPTRKPRRSTSYYRRLERRKAAAAEATAGSSLEEKSSEKCDNVPAAEVGSESEESEEVSSGEAATVSCPEEPSSAMNWINGINTVEMDYWTITNLEAIIIDTVASIEQVVNDQFGWRKIKCRHCRFFGIEPNFALHSCHSEEQRFKDEVLARVEPGTDDVRSILCL